MYDVSQIIAAVNVAAIMLAGILSLLYLLTIILVRRFHTTANILTGNVCLVTVIAACFWALLYVIGNFYPIIMTHPIALDIFSSYSETMFNCLVVYSMVIVTINRFLSIKHQHRRFFKKLIWSIISSIFEWILSVILPFPILILCYQRCTHGNNAPFWMRFYDLLCVVIFPSILVIIFNGLIYWTVKASSRRIHVIPTNSNAVGSVRPNNQNARDIRLLKHMSFIFIVFIVGWSPIYILTVVQLNSETPSWLLKFLQAPPIYTSIIIVIDLFIYNHDLTQYLKEKIFTIFH